MKEQEREWMESKRTVSVSEASFADDDQGSSTDRDQSSSSGEDLPTPKTPSKAQPTGQKITIDNIDYPQEVHHMTQDHQTIDKHYLTVCATENRVSGNHLGTIISQMGLSSKVSRMENVFQVLRNKFCKEKII
jgi:cytoskeletal protein RodZ